MGSKKTKRADISAGRAPAKRRGRAGSGRENWRSVLAGASPREVLARLMNGDPLGMRRLVGERIRQRAFLLDANQVQLRAVARCARFAVRYRGQPEIDRWLAEIVDEAMLDLVTEEHERAEGGCAAPEDAGVFRQMALPLQLDPVRMRLACARFNGLPEAQRCVFFTLMIEARDLDQVARERGDSASTVARQARSALEALLAAPQLRQGGTT